MASDNSMSCISKRSAVGGITVVGHNGGGVVSSTSDDWGGSHHGGSVGYKSGMLTSDDPSTWSHSRDCTSVWAHDGGSAARALQNSGGGGGD